MATKKASKAGEGKLHLKWVRSAIQAPVKHKLVVKGLGFTRLNQIIERPTRQPFAAWSRRCRIWLRSYSKVFEKRAGTMNLSSIRAPKKASSNKKRVGRGMGIGHGQDLCPRT